MNLPNHPKNMSQYFVLRFRVLALVPLPRQLFRKDSRGPSPFRNNCEWLFLGWFVPETMLVVHSGSKYSCGTYHSGCWPLVDFLWLFSIGYVRSQSTALWNPFMRILLELISDWVFAHAGTTLLSITESKFYNNHISSIKKRRIYDYILFLLVIPYVQI